MQERDKNYQHRRLRKHNSSLSKQLLKLPKRFRVSSIKVILEGFSSTICLCFLEFLSDVDNYAHGADWISGVQLAEAEMGWVS